MVQPSHVQGIEVKSCSITCHSMATAVALCTNYHVVIALMVY